jgi:hypothetical protein
VQEWSVWRLVVKQVATLQEVETYWSADDVARACGFLNLFDEFEYQAAQKAKEQ